MKHGMNYGMNRDINPGRDYARYAVRDFNRLLRRLFKRAARVLWCRPFDAALSMLDTASRYAALAASLFFSVISFSSFLIDVRKAERMLMLCMRRFTFWRARFRACGEFANGYPQICRVNFRAD